MIPTFSASCSDELAELNAHQVETGRVETASAAQQKQSMVYLRLIGFVAHSIEKVSILGERERRRELVTIR